MLGGAVAPITARVICPPGKSLSGAAGADVRLVHPREGLPPPGTSLRVRYSLRGDYLSGKREEA